VPTPSEQESEEKASIDCFIEDESKRETRRCGLRPHFFPCARFTAGTPRVCRWISTPPTQQGHRSSSQPSSSLSPSGLATLHRSSRSVWQCQPVPWKFRITGATFHPGRTCCSRYVYSRMSVVSYKTFNFGICSHSRTADAFHHDDVGESANKAIEVSQVYSLNLVATAHMSTRWILMAMG
jgi:hypothetical protein